jgi:hypothetical protein
VLLQHGVRTAARGTDREQHTLRGPPPGLDPDPSAIDGDDDDDSGLELTPCRRSANRRRPRVRVGLDDNAPFQLARNGRSLRAPPQ